MFVNCMLWSLEFGTGRPYNWAMPQLKPVRRKTQYTTVTQRCAMLMRLMLIAFKGGALGQLQCQVEKVDSKQWSLQVPVAVIVTNSPEQREAALDALVAAGSME